MMLRVLSTSFLALAVVGIFLRDADSDAVVVLAWAMIVIGAFGQVIFGLLYFFFGRDDKSG